MSTKRSCNCGEDEKGCACMILALGLFIMFVSIGIGGCRYLCKNASVVEVFPGDEEVTAEREQNAEK